VAISFEWYDDDKTVILVSYQGNWNWSEYFEAFKDMALLLEEVDHSVYTIHKVDTFPKGPILHQLTKTIKDKPDKIEIGIVVPNSNQIANSILLGMLRVISTTLQQQQPTFKIAKDLPEALLMIEQLKKTNYLKQKG
jgi:hypothetical protein